MGVPIDEISAVADEVRGIEADPGYTIDQLIGYHNYCEQMVQMGKENFTPARDNLEKIIADMILDLEY